LINYRIERVKMTNIVKHIGRIIKLYRIRAGLLAVSQVAARGNAPHE
jgi:hypothetical protein